MGRFSEWRTERGSWVLCEEIRADVRQLTAILDAQDDAGVLPKHRRLLDGARKELSNAEEVMDVTVHRRRLKASHVTTAQLHVNTARSLWLRTLGRNELESYMPSVLAVVRDNLPPNDERRIAVEQFTQEMQTKLAMDRAQGVPERPAQPGAPVGSDAEADPPSAPETKPQHKADQWLQRNLPRVIEALDAARQVALREKVRADSFARIVRWVAIGLTIIAISVAVLTGVSKSTIPLCFSPQAAPPSGNFHIVCPTNESFDVPQAQLGKEADRIASWDDYLVVELVGLVAAAIAAALALRKIGGTSTQFGVPVALAVLKLPTGALTAVLGLLLMRGAFVPGLSALDSSAQIIAWAALLGYAQEIFTMYVDARGKALLESARGEIGPKPPPPSRAEWTPQSGPKVPTGPSLR